MSRLLTIVLLNILYLGHAYSDDFNPVLVENPDGKAVTLRVISLPIKEIKAILDQYKLAVIDYKNQPDESVASQKFSKQLAGKLHSLLVILDKVSDICESFGRKKESLTLKKMVRKGKIDLNMLPSPNKITQLPNSTFFFHSKL